MPSVGSLLEHPEWLGPLTAAVVLAGAGWSIAWGRAQRRALRLLGEPSADVTRVRRRDGWLAVALLLLAVAWLGPRIGHTRVSVAGTGADVVLLVDLSRSMDARDGAPTRLGQATSIAAALTRRLDPDDRVALAGFAGHGVLFAPLTPDREAIVALLDGLDSTLIRPGGSDLGAGLAAAVTAFTPPDDRPRVIVLLSDGEASEPVDGTTADAARRAGARVVGMAIGGGTGVPIPVPGGVLHDLTGRVVETHRVLASLERLAADTDGDLVVAGRDDDVSIAGLAALVDREGPGSRSGLEASDPGSAPTRRVVVALVWPFAIGAALLLLLATGPGSGRRDRRPGDVDRPGRVRVSRARDRASRALGIVVGLGIAMLAAPTSTGGGVRDDEAGRWLEIGLRAAVAGDPDAAVAALSVATVLARSPEPVARAEYALGVLALERQDLAGARDHFLTSLVYAPGDRRTRFNAEWTLQVLAASAQAQPPPEDAPRPAAPGDPGPGEDAPPESSSLASAKADDEATGTGDDETKAGGEPGGTSGLAPVLTEADLAQWRARIRDDTTRSMQVLGAVSSPAGPRRSRMSW